MFKTIDNLQKAKGNKISMNEAHLWLKAKKVKIEKTEEIKTGFNIGFDEKVPEEVKGELKKFVFWVEGNFNIPITLWVDFEYKHYLKKRNGERAGFLFYWSDFLIYPVFNNENEIPEIRLPVRTEKSTIDEILCSFIEAISCYFAWILNIINDDFSVNYEEVEDVLKAYKRSLNK